MPPTFAVGQRTVTYGHACVSERFVEGAAKHAWTTKDRERNRSRSRENTVFPRLSLTIRRLRTPFSAKQNVASPAQDSTAPATRRTNNAPARGRARALEDFLNEVFISSEIAGARKQSCSDELCCGERDAASVEIYLCVSQQKERTYQRGSFRFRRGGDFAPRPYATPPLEMTSSARTSTTRACSSRHGHHLPRPPPDRFYDQRESV